MFFKYLIASFILLLLFTSIATAENLMQGMGSVTGRVSDSKNGEHLIGATVFLKDTRIGGRTDAYGSFRLQNIPVGSHTLVISSIGYDRREIPVEITADRATTINVTLEDTFITTGEVVVTGMLRGQSRAFNQQKEAHNVKNIISSEQIERFPDNNITEAVKRVPGVSTEPLRGESAAIMIRGLPSSFHTVTINNQRVASTDQANRATNTAIINSEMVSSIEVSKTITADMDADALSGNINLVTRMPVGEQRIANITAGSGYNNMSGRPQWITSATYGERQGNLSYVLNANFQKDNRATEDIRHDWGTVDFGSGDVDVLAGLRPSFYETERQRMGVAAQMEYSLNDRSTLYFMGSYNNYDEYEIRNDARHGISNGKFTSPTTAEGSRYEKVIREYNRLTDLITLNTGGKHDLGRSTLDYNVGYSFGSFNVPLREYYAFRHSDRPNYEFDISDREFATARFTNDFNPNDYSKMNFRYYERRRDDVKDNDLFGTLNFTVPYNLGDYSAFFKMGGKYWTKNKNRDIVDQRWTSYTGDEKITMAMFAVDEDRMMIGDRYAIGGAIDWEKGKDFFNRNESNFVIDENRTRERSDPNNYKAFETILAAYALTDITFGKFQLNAGVRAEHVANNYEGFSVMFDDNGDYLRTDPIKADDQDYFNLFPMLNIRYEIDPYSNLRFSFTSTIARPNFQFLVPYELVNNDNDIINQGNPNLNPSKSLNFDLMYERFFRSIGIFSAGVFFKDMKDFIYTETGIISDGGQYDGFRLVRPENGESAYLYGFELAWQQQLSFLPGFLRDFGVYANFSYIESEARIAITSSTVTYIPGEWADERKVRLPKQAPFVFNIALSYDKGGFSTQLSYAFRDTWLHAVGAHTSAPSLSEREGYMDRFLQYSGQLDLVMSYNINRNIRVFANFNNLTNQSHQHYFNDPIYPYRNSFHSWWSNFGVRYSL